MPLHLYFNYTLPFAVGDEVYIPFDAPGTDYEGKRIDYKYYKGKIHNIAIIFIGNANYGTIITEPKEEHEVGVSGFIISVHPKEEYKISSEPIHYSVHVPNIFITEEEVIAYQKGRSN